MAHLLQTVILSCPSSLHAFINALEYQHLLNGRLQFNYARHVKNLWIAEDYDPFVAPMNTHYPYLYQFLQEARLHSFGIHSLAMSALWEGFDSLHPGVGLNSWSCPSVTFSGDLWRWNVLTSSAGGFKFLQGIQTLVLDFPVGDSVLDDANENRKLIPGWMNQVPWGALTNLRQLAFPLAIDTQQMTTPQKLIYYGDAQSMGQWINSANPLAFGRIVDDEAAQCIPTSPKGLDGGLVYGLAFALRL
ncbi:hypothetical protein AX16_003994 [Volvariella volvacea WC 439]|nr:hypothetical protein AX16_003994 [Volvariella volvacea WC 439]